MLAAIIRNITIPASELGVEPMPGDAPAPSPTPAPAPAEPAPPPPPPPPPPSEPAPAPTRAAAPARARPAPAPAREPARYWVQIAIAANVSALPGEWRRLSRAAPETMKGKTAWTAPLGRTNRLLAGPFDNARQAQAFINDLAKEGLAGAYSWRSDEGEKVDRVRTR